MNDRKPFGYLFETVHNGSGEVVQHSFAYANEPGAADLMTANGQPADVRGFVYRVTPLYTAAHFPIPSQGTEPKGT